MDAPLDIKQEVGLVDPLLDKTYMKKFKQEKDVENGLASSNLSTETIANMIKTEVIKNNMASLRPLGVEEHNEDNNTNETDADKNKSNKKRKKDHTKKETTKPYKQKQNDDDDDEANQLVEQFKREKEAQKNSISAYSESDSDSGVEETKKRRRKNKQKKKQKEVKNIRRKKPRELVNAPVEDLPSTPIDDDFLTMKNGKDKALSLGKILLNHPSICDRDLNRMSAKELQVMDAKINPLVSQKFYYTEKNDRDFSLNDAFGVDDESDIDTLESGLHTMQPSVDDLPLMVERLRKGIKSYVPQTKEEFISKLNNVLEMVTRKQEEAQLRTPMAGERRCLRDDNCEGTKIPGAIPCILVERLSAKEKIEYSLTKKLPQTRRLCVMCLRYLVLFLYVSILAEELPIRSNVILSKCGNHTDKAGEYLFDQTIMNGSKNLGVPVPVVAHCRFYYKQKVQDGKIFLFISL